MHFLITRPANQARKTARKLDDLGHTSVIEPLLTIEPTGQPFPKGHFDAVVVTSMNCLPHLNSAWPKQKGRQLPLLATGSAVAEEAGRFGFTSVHHVSGSALDLVAEFPNWSRSISQTGLGSILYPCAEKVAHPVDELLAEQGVQCTQWPVYRARPAAQFSTDTEAALNNGAFDGILLYSARTAHTFVQLLKQSHITINGPRVFALSQQIVDILPENLKFNAISPSKPNESALLDLIGG